MGYTKYGKFVKTIFGVIVKKKAKEKKIGSILLQ